MYSFVSRFHMCKNIFFFCNRLKSKLSVSCMAEISNFVQFFLHDYFYKLNSRLIIRKISKYSCSPLEGSVVFEISSVILVKISVIFCNILVIFSETSAEFRASEKFNWGILACKVSSVEFSAILSPLSSLRSSVGLKILLTIVGSVANAGIDINEIINFIYI